jgi:hypothetical protein
MTIHTHDPLARSGATLLSVGIAAALAITSGAARSGEPLTKLAAPTHPSAIHPVSNCNSSGAGSLNAVIADMGTVNGDVVDLTPLKLVCSTISVQSVDVHQDNLILQGPGAKYLKIDGGNSSRLFHHSGTGTLALSGLALANGYYAGASEPTGGCIDSKGSISLVDSIVSHCTVKGTGSNGAYGGGVHAMGNLNLLRSTITDSHAIGVGSAGAAGGGALVIGNFTALYSTISNNTAAVPQGGAFGYGGGVKAFGDVDIEESTISGNHADQEGALGISGGAAHMAYIANSTISNNVGSIEYGGIGTNVPTTLRNSTIAFNHSPLGIAGKGAGVHATSSPLLLVSTIIAGNSASDGPNDLGGLALSVSSHNNLVVASSLPLPLDTIHECPKLDVLADNGGQTLTNGLKEASEALDHGSEGSLMIDQRLAPRVTGPHADIGAVERQQSDVPERLLASGFDGLCDQ